MNLTILLNPFYGSFPEQTSHKMSRGGERRTFDDYRGGSSTFRSRDYDRSDNSRSSRRDCERDRDREYERDRYGGRRDGGGSSGSSRPRYDKEYESRKFQESRRESKRDRQRSRSRDYRREHKSREYLDERERFERKYDDRLRVDVKGVSGDESKLDSVDEARSGPQANEKSTSNYLSSLSDRKLQETYEKYQNDPDFDITDGLLDNIVIDKEKIHQEMQERLRQHLAAEGKVYPPPKPEPTQTMFANDGSFLDFFKKMQEQQQEQIQQANSGNSLATFNKVLEPKKPPVFGKRRGGKILKTGIVEKKKPVDDPADNSATDAWSLYMQEVKRYKNVSCDVDNKTRPLVK